MKLINKRVVTVAVSVAVSASAAYAQVLDGRPEAVEIQVTKAKVGQYDPWTGVVHLQLPSECKVYRRFRKSRKNSIPAQCVLEMGVSRWDDDSKSWAFVQRSRTAVIVRENILVKRDTKGKSRLFFYIGPDPKLSNVGVYRIALRGLWGDMRRVGTLKEIFTSAPIEITVSRNERNLAAINWFLKEERTMFGALCSPFKHEAVRSSFRNVTVQDMQRLVDRHEEMIKRSDGLVRTLAQLQLACNYGRIANGDRPKFIPIKGSKSNKKRSEEFYGKATTILAGVLTADPILDQLKCMQLATIHQLAGRLDQCKSTLIELRKRHEWCIFVGRDYRGQ